MKYRVLVGADDPEMRLVEKTFRSHSIPVLHAKIGQHRVNPGTCYLADRIAVAADEQLVVVECAFVHMPDSTISFDHHRPGDHGFALPPEEFWEAASIGQVYRLLGLEPTREALVMAAFDHCFAAAVRGECPGVTKEEVIHLRVVEVARQARVTGTDVWNAVLRYRKLIAGSPELTMGGQTVKDFRAEHLGVGYTLSYLAAQFAAAMDDVPVLLRHHDPTRKTEKNTLTGASLAAIVDFMNVWGPAHGLTRFFGAPSRGYAAGFVSRRKTVRTA